MCREFIQALDPASTFFPGAAMSQLTVLETAVGIALPDELRRRPAHHHNQRQRDGAGFYYHAGLRQTCGKP